ncbi:tetratricopeptide repeat protein, partial [bacterium]|nr:tetratricopeptide repeat protein [bacterium]
PVEMKNRNTATVQNNLAMLYWQIGDKANAEGHINSAMKIDPESETIKHNFDIITGEADGKLLYLMLH